jgi:hypothetical protein
VSNTIAPRSVSGTFDGDLPESETETEGETWHDQDGPDNIQGKKNLPSKISDYLLGRQANLLTSREAPSANNIPMLDIKNHRCVGAKLDADEGRSANDVALVGTCEWLEALSLVFDESLKALFCHIHGIFLSSESCVRHIMKQHNDAIPYRHDKTKFIKSIVDHISEVIGEICESADDIYPPKVLDKPLDIQKANRNIRYRYQCPICSKWITRNESYRGNQATELFHHHYSSQHSGQPRPNLTAVRGSWCQEVQISGVNGGRTHIIELTGYSPPPKLAAPATLLAVNRMEGPPAATWFCELKWDEYRQYLGVDSIEFLQGLVAPPLTKYQLEAIRERESRWLESGISYLRMLITELIKDGQNWADGLHGTFLKSLRPRLVT